MLEFFQNENQTQITVTLTEFVTLENSLFYLFIFKHIETKTIIAFTVDSSLDLSQYKWRYNLLNIDVKANFIDKNAPIGRWNYEVYQQNNSSNLDPNNSNGLLEKGKMIYYPSSPFEYKQYNPSTSYKSYNG